VPRTCTVCTHPECAAIDAALVAGEPYRAIARQHGVSRHAITRHKAAHLPVVLVKAQGVAEVTHGDDLLAKMTGLEADAKRIGTEAEKKGDLRTALAAIRELIRIVELLAKVQGELNEQAVVNVILSPEWVAVRTAVMVAMQPYPEARRALAARLLALENE
jgi:hypothetical protein